MFKRFWNWVRWIFGTRPVVYPGKTTPPVKMKLAPPSPKVHKVPQLKKMRVGHSLQRSHFGQFRPMKPLMFNRTAISTKITNCKHGAPYGTRELSAAA
jgi:hypothetical protein